MKQFSIKIILFSLIVFLILTLYLLLYANGKIDSFYLKIASSKHNSLIIGSSRASVGIEPSLFRINNKSIDMFNYAFALTTSDFGPTYFNAIKKKLKTNIKEKGLFIIEVNPRSLSVSKQNINDCEDLFPEKDNFLGKLHLYNIIPNYEYVFKFSSKPLYYMFLKNLRPVYDLSNEKKNKKAYKYFGLDYTITSANGRVLINIPDSLYSKNKEKSRITMSELQNSKKSTTRLRYLNLIIKYLKDYGNVYIVRMPIDKDFLKIENIFWSDFNSEISNLAKQNKVLFYDFNISNKRYDMPDGHHLSCIGGYEFTNDLIKIIQDH